MFKFHCPKCGLTAEGPDDLTGKPCPGCGEMIGGSGAQLAPGDNIGGYEIIRLLGSGGTGNVYLALQLSMNRQIAVKVLYPELTKDGESVRQFFSEVQTLGNIQHGNIVCAFDSGVDQERKLCYLAMQYIPGQPLDVKVEQSGPIPVLKALRIVESIAEALNYVWTKYQLCHRDIKPGNIMLNEDDVPMLLDFGAVLHVGENSISNGMVEGSPCYMSPEQARGEKLTFASDLYSLGETLYFLVTGVPPFDDPDVHEILRKQCEAPFPPPAQRAPKCDVPQEIVSFLRKTMAKSPVDRFESWEEFLSELKKVRRAVSGKGGSPARGAARPTPTVKTAAVKATGAAASKISPLDKLNAASAADGKRKKGRIFLAINYLMISLLTAGAIAFMLSRSNTQSAENRMIEVRAAMKNVRENDKDPEGAKDKIRRARAEAKKFGVKQDVIQEIEEECAEEMRFIEMIEAENLKAERIQLDVSSLMSELVAARAALKRNFNEENIAEMNRIRTGLIDQSKKILTVSFVRPANEEKMRQAVGAINAQIKVIDELVKPMPEVGKVSQTGSVKNTVTASSSRYGSSAASAARKADDKASAAAAEAERKKAAAEEEKARKKKEEEEKVRRKERYRKKLEQGREKVARELVLEVRKGNLKRAEQLLTSSQDMKAPDSDCRDMEEAYNKWLATIRAVFKEARPVLRDISPDEVNKKDRIYSLAGGNKSLLSRSLILCGYFTEAQNLIQPEDRDVLRDISVAYLTPRISRAISNARKGNDAELRALREEYEKFEPYTDLENTVRARITGGK